MGKGKLKNTVMPIGTRTSHFLHFPNLKTYVFVLNPSPYSHCPPRHLDVGRGWSVHYIDILSPESKALVFTLNLTLDTWDFVGTGTHDFGL